MAGKQTLRAELEEQRLIIERQQFELLRQQHQIEMQRRRTPTWRPSSMLSKPHFNESLLPLSDLRGEPPITAAATTGPPVASAARRVPQATNRDVNCDRSVTDRCGASTGVFR
jgi:hypothetical protein